ncbi:unnamed protein product, partial [Effrenium voratum]
ERYTEPSANIPEDRRKTPDYGQSSRSSGQASGAAATATSQPPRQWGRQYAQRTTKDAAPAVDSGVASLGDDWMMIGMG